MPPQQAFPPPPVLGWRSTDCCGSPGWGPCPALDALAQECVVWDAHGFHRYVENCGWEIDADEVFGDYLEWRLGRVEAAPVFSFLFVIDPHAPYLPPGDFGRRFDPEWEGTPITNRPQLLRLRGVRSGALVSHVDILPTILDCLHLPHDRLPNGFSLLDTVGRYTPDPGEQHNVVGLEAGRREELAATLRMRHARLRESAPDSLGTAPMDEETLRQLKSLGYLK